MNDDIKCHKLVDVRGGAGYAVSNNCKCKVVYVDPMGRGWCKRHQPDEDRKAAWAAIASTKKMS